MPVSDLCSKNLVCIDKGATLQQAAQLMKKYNVGGVVVVEGNGFKKPVGVLTDRDITMSVVAESVSRERKIEDVMSKSVIKVAKDEGIAAVVDKMEHEAIRRIVVVDNEGDACGLVSSDDVLQLVAREIHGLGKLVEQQTKSERSYRPKIGDLWLRQ